ncbi:hypothetical protein ACM26V_15745 [Salipaludibacillus sp. HK11]|uniref:hypothetical protein n=1 Tax=Salipaludibacillus sp. HK11 TaxID=3394320 RepID=UPI0039FD6AF1
MNSIKEVCEKIWEIEEENDLLRVELQGIKVWEVIRFSVFNIITNKLGFYGSAHSTANKTILSKIKKGQMLVANSFTKNPFRSSFKGNTMILDHPRKVKVNGDYIDIYSQKLLSNMDSEGFFVVEYPYLDKHFSDHSDPNRSYMDIFYAYATFKMPFMLFKFNKEELDILLKIEGLLNESFDVNMKLKNLIYKKIITFKLKYYFFDSLLKKKKPDNIVLVVSYSNFPLIAAAKDNDIEVTELQHGVITNYHFAYNFSDPKKIIKYFPDKLLTFGEYWAKTDGFPKQTEVEVYGFPYLNQQLEKYKGTQKKKRQVLFLSQGTIGKELSKRAKEVAESMPEYHFIYKLHPGEYSRWRKEYPDLLMGSNLDNLQVVDHNEKNLYSFFAESEYQVGVYSTAIFEGLTMDCKTILFNLKGIEYMQDLIEQDLVMVANDKIEFINNIENFNVKQVDKGHFFKTVNT